MPPCGNTENGSWEGLKESTPRAEGSRVAGGKLMAMGPMRRSRNTCVCTPMLTAALFTKACSPNVCQQMMARDVYIHTVGKQDQELTVAQIVSSLLPISDLN